MWMIYQWLKNVEMKWLRCYHSHNSSMSGQYTSAWKTQKWNSKGVPTVVTVKCLYMYVSIWKCGVEYNDALPQLQQLNVWTEHEVKGKGVPTIKCLMCMSAFEKCGGEGISTLSVITAQYMNSATIIKVEHLDSCQCMKNVEVKELRCYRSYNSSVFSIKTILTLRSRVWDMIHLLMNCWGSFAKLKKNSRFVFSWLMVSTVSWILLSKLYKVTTTQIRGFLKTEAAGYFKILVHVHQTTWHHALQACHLELHGSSLHLDFLLTCSWQEEIVHLCLQCVIDFHINIVTRCLFLFCTLHTAINKSIKEKHTYQSAHNNTVWYWDGQFTSCIHLQGEVQSSLFLRN